MFKYTKNNYSRNQKTWWYACSFKSTDGCTAKAHIEREEFVGEDGELYVRNTMTQVSTPEVHADYHVPDQAAVIADHVMVDIKAVIDKDPTAPVGVYQILYYNVLIYCTTLYQLSCCHRNAFR